MDRFDGTELRRVFEIDRRSEGWWPPWGGRVLNPQAISTQDGYIHIFVPDRSSTRVRWWRMNIETEELQRFDDISLPARGARMYDLRYEDGKIICPISISQELHIGVIDTEKLTIETTLLDRFKSPDRMYRYLPLFRMPPRSVNLFKYEELGLYLITYLRPAQFSRRWRTGLVGEVVARALDMTTLESVNQTVIGGYTAETAATHSTDSEQLNNSMFAVAYTTVDRVNQYHLTGKHGNYVSSHLAIWALDAAGAVTKIEEQVTQNTWHGPGLARVDDQTFLFSYSPTTASKERRIDELTLEDRNGDNLGSAP